MAVVTRSTTRRTSSQTQLPSKATKTSPGSSLKTTSRPSAKALTLAKTKVTRRNTSKRSSKTADGQATAVAREAADAKRAWEEFVAARPPLNVLDASGLSSPENGHSAPRRIYGWPFSREYMLEYARRHGLVFNVPESCRSKYDGKAKFNFADITDDHLADEQSLARLQKVATRLVLNYLEMKTGADLSLGSPISLEWKHMLVIWSTEDADEKYGIYRCLRIWEKLKTFIDAAMNERLPEGCEGRTSLQWWWSREKTKRL